MNEASMVTAACSGDAGMREALFGMEADLRTLQGVMASCRIFGEAPDPIDPAAVAVLAASGGEAVQNLLTLWSQGLSAAEDPRSTAAGERANEREGELP